MAIKNYLYQFLLLLCFMGEYLMNDNFLSVNELAEFLNVPKSWIYSRTRETGPDAMPSIKVGKYCRFVLDDVLDWLKNQNESD